MSPWDMTTTLMQGTVVFLCLGLMRLIERNSAYETVKTVGPGQPEESQPPPLEQQRQVVVSPHTSSPRLHLGTAPFVAEHSGSRCCKTAPGQALRQLGKYSSQKGGGSVKRYPNIDYSYQPKSYWDEDNVLQTILRDVKGAERRKMIKAYYDDGKTCKRYEEETGIKGITAHPIFSLPPLEFVIGLNTSPVTRQRG